MSQMPFNLTNARDPRIGAPGSPFNSLLDSRSVQGAPQRNKRTGRTADEINTEYKNLTGRPGLDQGTPLSYGGGREAELIQEWRGVAPGRNMSHQFFDALVGDAAGQQKLADEQYGRVNREIEGMRGILDSAGSRIETATKNSAERLSKVAADQRAEFEGHVAKNMQQFEDTTLQDADAMRKGLTADMERQLAQVRSGRGPNGEMLTPEQQAFMTKQIRTTTQNTVATTLSQIRSQFNQQRAQLNQGYSQQRLGSQQSQMQAEMTRAEIERQGPLVAMQFELQGRQALADMVASNPRSLVSMASIFSTYFSAASAGMGNRDTIAYGYGT